MSNTRRPCRCIPTSGIIPSELASTLNAGIQTSTFLSASILEDLLKNVTQQQTNSQLCPPCNVILLASNPLRPHQQDEYNNQNRGPHPQRSGWNRLGTPCGSQRSSHASRYRPANIQQPLPLWAADPRMQFAYACPCRSMQAPSVGDNVGAECPTCKARFQSSLKNIQLGQLDPIIESTQENVEVCEPEPVRAKTRKKRPPKKRTKKCRVDPSSPSICSCVPTPDDITSPPLNSGKENAGRESEKVHLERCSRPISKKNTTRKSSKSPSLPSAQGSRGRDSKRGGPECTGDFASPTPPKGTSPVRPKNKKKKNSQRKGGGEAVEYSGLNPVCCPPYPRQQLKSGSSIQQGSRPQTMSNRSKRGREGRNKRKSGNRKPCCPIIVEQKPVYAGSASPTKTSFAEPVTVEDETAIGCLCDDTDELESNIVPKDKPLNKHSQISFQSIKSSSNKALQTNVDEQCETEDSEINEVEDECKVENKVCGTQCSGKMNRCFQTCNLDCPSLRPSFSTHSIKSYVQRLESIAEESVSSGNAKYIDSSGSDVEPVKMTACCRDYNTQERPAPFMDGISIPQQSPGHGVNNWIPECEDSRNNEVSNCAEDTHQLGSKGISVNSRESMNQTPYPEIRGCICSGTEMQIPCPCKQILEEERRRNDTANQIPRYWDNTGISQPSTSGAATICDRTLNVHDLEGNCQNTSGNLGDNYDFPCCFKLEPINGYNPTSDTQEPRSEFNVVRMKCAESCPNKKQCRRGDSTAKSVTSTTEQSQLKPHAIPRNSPFAENYMTRVDSKKPTDSIPQENVKGRKEDQIFSHDQVFSSVGNYLNGVKNVDEGLAHCYSKPRNINEKTQISNMEHQYKCPSRIFGINDADFMKEILRNNHNSVESVKVKDASKTKPYQYGEKEGRNKIPLGEAIHEIVRHTHRIKMQEMEDAVSLHERVSFTSGHELTTKNSLCLHSGSLDEISYRAPSKHGRGRSDSISERKSDFLNDNAKGQKKHGRVETHSESCLLSNAIDKLTKSSKVNRAHSISKDSKSSGDSLRYKTNRDAKCKIGSVEKNVFYGLTENILYGRSSVKGKSVDTGVIKSSDPASKTDQSSKVVHPKYDHLSSSKIKISQTSRHQSSDASVKPDKIHKNQTKIVKNLCGTKNASDGQKVTRVKNSEENASEHNAKNEGVERKKAETENKESVSENEKEKVIKVYVKCNSQKTTNTEQDSIVESQEVLEADERLKESLEEIYKRYKAQVSKLRTEPETEIDHKDSQSSRLQHRNRQKLKLVCQIRNSLKTQMNSDEAEIGDDSTELTETELRDKGKDGKNSPSKSRSPRVKSPTYPVKKLKTSCRCCPRCRACRSTSVQPSTTSFPELRRNKNLIDNERVSPERCAIPHYFQGESLHHKARSVESRQERKEGTGIRSRGDTTIGVAIAATKGNNALRDSEIGKRMTSIDSTNKCSQRLRNRPENIVTQPRFFIGGCSTLEAVQTTWEIRGQKQESTSVCDPAPGSFATRSGSIPICNDLVSLHDSRRVTKSVNCEGEQSEFIDAKGKKIVGVSGSNRINDISSLTENNLLPDDCPLKYEIPTSFHYNPKVSFEQNLENLRFHRSIYGVSSYEMLGDGNSQPVMRPIMRPKSVSSCSTILSVSGVKFEQARANTCDLKKNKPGHQPQSTTLTRGMAIAGNNASSIKLSPIHETLTSTPSRNQDTTGEVMRKTSNIESHNRLSDTTKRGDQDDEDMCVCSCDREEKVKEIIKSAIKECVSCQLSSKENERKDIISSLSDRSEVTSKDIEDPSTVRAKVIELTGDKEDLIIIRSRPHESRSGEHQHLAISSVTDELSNVQCLGSQEAYNRNVSDVSVVSPTTEEDTVNKFGHTQQKKSFMRDDSGDCKVDPDISFKSGVANVRKHNCIGKPCVHGSHASDTHLQHDCIACETTCSSKCRSGKPNRYAPLPVRQENAGASRSKKSNSNQMKLETIHCSRNTKQMRKRNRSTMPTSSTDFTMTSITSSSDSVFGEQPIKKRHLKGTKGKSHQRHKPFKYQNAGRRRFKKRTVTIQQSECSHLGESVMRPVMQPISASSTSTILSGSGVTFQIADFKNNAGKAYLNICNSHLNKGENVQDKIPVGLPEKCCHGRHVSNQYAARYQEEHITDEVFYNYPRSTQIPIQSKNPENINEPTRSTPATLNHQFPARLTNKVQSTEVKETFTQSKIVEEKQTSSIIKNEPKSNNTQSLNVREERPQVYHVQEMEARGPSIAPDGEENLSDTLPGQICRAISKVIYQALCKPDTYMTLKNAMDAFTVDVEDRTQSFEEKYNKNFDDRFTVPERDGSLSSTGFKTHYQYNVFENRKFPNFIPTSEYTKFQKVEPVTNVSIPTKITTQEHSSDYLSRANDDFRLRGRKVSWSEIKNCRSVIKVTEIKKKTIQAMPGVRCKLVSERCGSFENDPLPILGTFNAKKDDERCGKTDTRGFRTATPIYPQWECAQDTVVDTKTGLSQTSLDLMPCPADDLLSPTLNGTPQSTIPLNILGKTVKLSFSPIVQVNKPPEEGDRGCNVQASDEHLSSCSSKLTKNCKLQSSEVPCEHQNESKKGETRSVDLKDRSTSIDVKSISKSNSRTCSDIPPSPQVERGNNSISQDLCASADGYNHLREINKSTGTSMRSDKITPAEQIRTPYADYEINYFKRSTSITDDNNCSRYGEQKPVCQKSYVSDCNFAIRTVISDRVLPSHQCNSNIPIKDCTKENNTGLSVFQLLE